jgi:hypothetical protein
MAGASSFRLALRCAAHKGMAPLPLMTQQGTMIGRCAASARRSCRLADGTAWDHVLVLVPMCLRQPNGHGHRKQSYR